jgi:N-acetylglucosamine-6-phosphate deacetylase
MIIATLAERGLVVCAGHSMADFDQALSGVDAGLIYGTHLLNAMPPLDHRLPGLPGMFRIGEFEVTSDGVSARLADGTLAGSILSLDAALRNLSKCRDSESLSEVIEGDTQFVADFASLLPDTSREAHTLLFPQTGASEFA